MLSTATRSVTRGIVTASPKHLNEWVGNSTFRHTLVTPSKREILLWVQRHGKSGELERISAMPVLDELSDTAKPSSSNARRVVRLLLWGGSDLLETAAPFYGGYRAMARFVSAGSMEDRWVSLLESSWRKDVPMDSTELALISRVFHDRIPKWFTVGELAYLALRDIELIASLGRIYPTEVFGVDTSVPREFQRAAQTGSALAWFALYVGMGGEVEESVDRELVDMMLECARTLSFDAARPFIDAGVCDASLIRQAIDNSLDPSLMVSVMQ